VKSREIRDLGLRGEDPKKRDMLLQERKSVENFLGGIMAWHGGGQNAKSECM